MKDLHEIIDWIRNGMFLQFGAEEVKFDIEKDVEDQILSCWSGTNIIGTIKNQVLCDAPDANEYIIDLVIKANDGFLPIEIKHSASATYDEVKEDIEKLKYYVEHYSDMPQGVLIYFTKKANDPLTGGMSHISINNTRGFYYHIIERNIDTYNEHNSISFVDRWEAKEIE